MNPEQRLQQIEPQLALDSQQKAAFEQYARTVRLRDAVDARGDRAAGCKCLVRTRQTRCGRCEGHAAVRSSRGTAARLPARTGNGDLRISGKIVASNSGRNLSSWRASGPGRDCTRTAPGKSKSQDFGSLENLARVNALGIADLAEIGRVDDQIAGADAVGAARYLPQIIAGLHGICLPRRQLHGGRLRQRHDDALHDASVFSQLIETQLEAPRTDHSG